MSVTNVGKKILVIDDETPVLHLMKVFLEDEGFEVIVCNNPLEITRVMKQEKIDAIVCDFLMPHKNGLECIQGIRQEYGREIPIIMSTAVLNMDLEKVRQAGGDHLINKPINFQNLIEILDKELSKIHPEKINVNASISLNGKTNKKLIKWTHLVDERFHFEVPKDLCALNTVSFYEVSLKTPNEDIVLPFKGETVEIIQMNQENDLIIVELKISDKSLFEKMKAAYNQEQKNITELLNKSKVSR